MSLNVWFEVPLEERKEDMEREESMPPGEPWRMRIGRPVPEVEASIGPREVWIRGVESMFC